ncbi:MAG: hypothetical protein MI919_18530, partial [Holophagales bacterium]|nr:hypothetical protein [Holophagales bacterium]
WERHLIWLVQQYPANEEAAVLTRQLRPLPYDEAFELARRLWLEQVERYPFDPRVQANAARFFSLDDRELAEELLERAASLEPQNPDWSRQLELLRELETRSRRGAGVDVAAARQAVGSFAAVLAGATRAERDALLGDAARAALQAGDFVRSRTWATEMVERAREAPAWNAGNLEHEGHLLLGRLDLRSGDLASARGHLSSAGGAARTPRLRGLGPGMKLAEELLVEGEAAAVVSYLDRCASLWEAGADRLAIWKQEIAQGRIPDFGVLLGR